MYTVLHAIPSPTDYMEQQIHLLALRKYSKYKLNFKGLEEVKMWELLFMHFVMRKNDSESLNGLNKKNKVHVQ